MSFDNLQSNRTMPFMNPITNPTLEQARLRESRESITPWKKWGPYLSDRQWGTVREDYSENGDAWNYFSHDQARSRAYRWGEDGIAGISDDKQRLCFSLALWNGKDPIIKERFFGLTNSESNHGEDVKEYYYYLDSTPTHSYMKMLYKYPQAAFPYDNLVETSMQRNRNEMEYELIDTGVFSEDRYFDVIVEYAKAAPEDILVKITVFNRGPEAAELQLLPTLWFRNTWSWDNTVEKPLLNLHRNRSTIVKAVCKELGTRFLYCDGNPSFLFTENETNQQKLFGMPNPSPYVKDGINDLVVHGDRNAVNPKDFGTKVSAQYLLNVEGQSAASIRLRLSDVAPDAVKDQWGGSPFGHAFDTILADRLAEANAFYGALLPGSLGPDRINVARQALAGMLWSKQFYYYDVDRWLAERGASPYQAMHKNAPRNEKWLHLYNGDVISIPDKWEYPWYAAWDLAFHVIALSLVDPQLAKDQLSLMLEGRYMHPNGQIPAYEWNFGDANPPVHAWSTLFTYRLEKMAGGTGDIEWLKKCFQKLLLNFTWWVNRKDRDGRNVFEGGFLGLDNIGVFDRSAPLPTGGYLEQADGTAWMALFSQNMLDIAAELTMHDASYGEMALKFVEHFLWIASSMVHLGDNTGMWDEEDGFFYDVLRLPDGSAQRLKVRSMVGLLPLCAATMFTGKLLEAQPEIATRFNWFLKSHAELTKNIHPPDKTGFNGRRLASIMDESRLRKVLRKMLDENEFLSKYGIRSLSRYHLEHPFVFHSGGKEYRVTYLPGESDTCMFGGNSNWRGPIWMPVNALIVRALLQYYTYYGNEFKVECPTGSGKLMNLYEVAAELTNRLSSIFLRNESGMRPVFGGARKFQEDSLWNDHLLFYEYFHGDNGAGLGASHQTGWTGLIARLMHLFATTTAGQILDAGTIAQSKPSPRKSKHTTV